MITRVKNQSLSPTFPRHTYNSP